MQPWAESGLSCVGESLGPGDLPALPRLDIYFVGKAVTSKKIIMLWDYPTSWGTETTGKRRDIFEWQCHSLHQTDCHTLHLVQSTCYTGFAVLSKYPENYPGRDTIETYSSSPNHKVNFFRETCVYMYMCLYINICIHVCDFFFCWRNIHFSDFQDTCSNSRVFLSLSEFKGRDRKAAGT